MQDKKKIKIVHSFHLKLASREFVQKITVILAHNKYSASTKELYTTFPYNTYETTTLLTYKGLSFRPI